MYTVYRGLIYTRTHKTTQEAVTPPSGLNDSSCPAPFLVFPEIQAPPDEETSHMRLDDGGGQTEETKNFLFSHDGQGI